MDVDLLPVNPLRPPDWRWSRAAKLARGESYSRLSDDKWTRSAARVLSELQQPHPNLPRLLNERNAPLFMAHKLATEHAPAYQQMRAEVDARILGGVSDQTLSRLTGLTPSTIAAYEALFFDTRGRLSRTAFILHFIIGSHNMRSITEHQYSTLWRLIGYYAGPRYLDIFISGFGERSLLDGLPLAAGMDKIISDKRRQKAIAAALTVGINPMTAEIIMKSWDSIKQMEHLTKTAGENAGSPMIANIEAMIGHLEPFVMGHPTEDEHHHALTLVAHYEKSCELRPDELVAVSMGKPLPHAAMFETMKFREPGQ